MFSDKGISSESYMSFFLLGEADIFQDVVRLFWASEDFGGFSSAPPAFPPSGANSETCAEAGLEPAAGLTSRLPGSVSRGRPARAAGHENAVPQQPAGHSLAAFHPPPS